MREVRRGLQLVDTPWVIVGGGGPGMVVRLFFLFGESWVGSSGGRFFFGSLGLVLGFCPGDLDEDEDLVPMPGTLVELEEERAAAFLGFLGFISRSDKGGMGRLDKEVIQAQIMGTQWSKRN